MKKRLLLLLLLWTYISSAQNAAYNIGSDDSSFVQTLVEDGLIEIQLGKIAQTKATSIYVKMNGEDMIHDNLKAIEQLKIIAQKRNISLPTEMSNDKQKKYNELTNLNGKEFDRQYSEWMVQLHRKGLSLFKKELKKGKDNELKAWVSEELRTFENHLTMWQESCYVIKQ